jgi:hypothetical protein
VQAVRTAVGRIRAVHADLRAFVRGDAPQRVQVDVREGLRATVAMLRRNVSAEVTVQEARSARCTTATGSSRFPQTWFF